MDEQTEISDEAAGRMVRSFGEASVRMLTETPLIHAWRISFLANFYTGPIYRKVEDLVGLTRPQFVILFCLSQQSGLAAKDICLLTGLPRNSISRAVSELRERRLIDRATRDDDKRSKTLILTDLGSDLLARVVPLFVARQSAMRSALSEQELRQFDALLTKMILAMPEWATEA